MDEGCRLVSGRVVTAGGTGVLAVAVVAGGALADEEIDQDERSDDGKETPQDVPAGVVGVVQAPHGDGEAGDERRQRVDDHQEGDKAGEGLPCGGRPCHEAAGNDVDSEVQEIEPPVLGPRGASAEGGILCEYTLDGLCECHHNNSVF